MKRPISDRELDLSPSACGQSASDAEASSGSPPGWRPWALPASTPGRRRRPRSSLPARSSPRSRRSGTAAAALPSQQDPSSHDFNKDLYCDGVPALWAGPDEVQRRVPGRALRREQGHLEPATAPSGPSPSGAIEVVRRRARARARDFEYSWKRQLDPATKAPYAAFLYDLKNGEAFNKGQLTDAGQVGVRAKDDWTLEVTLEGPRGYFPVLSAYLAALPGTQGVDREARRQVDGAGEHRLQRAVRPGGMGARQAAWCSGRTRTTSGRRT